MDFYADNSTDVVLPIGNLMKRDLWDNIGIDNGFMGLYWDVDMAMQNYTMGGKVLICEKAKLIDEKEVNRPRLCLFNNGFDKELFYSYWSSVPGQLRSERSQLIKPLELTTSVCYESQGNKGAWE